MSDYKQTIELENNINLKNKADKIYSDFLANVKLEPKNYKGDGRFVLWSDSHNSIYLKINSNCFEFQCRFLHETYNVVVTPSEIFTALKNKNRGVEHLISHVSK